MRDGARLDHEGDFRGIELRFRVVFRVPVYLYGREVFDRIVVFLAAEIDDRLFVSREDTCNCPSFHPVLDLRFCFCLLPERPGRGHILR